MPWFYYSGNIARPIPVRKGISVAVRPHTKVEIIDTQSREVQALKGKGLLKPTGRPVDAVSVKEKQVPTATVADVTPRSALSERIAEKGVTIDKGQAPRKIKGSPEMTEGELRAVEPKVRDSESAEPKAEKSLKGADIVDVLSSDESSPADKKGKKKAKKKKDR
jgi:hypothetical protein